MVKSRTDAIRRLARRSRGMAPGPRRIRFSYPPRQRAVPRRNPRLLISKTLTARNAKVPAPRHGAMRQHVSDLARHHFCRAPDFADNVPI